MYRTACLDISKLLQALPTKLSRFGSHSLDKATEFVPEILSSSQISHYIPLNHCKLPSKAHLGREKTAQHLCFHLPCAFPCAMVTLRAQSYAENMEKFFSK